MNQTEPPRIEFPCAYPIKVMGDAAPDFRDVVLEVMQRHAGPVDETGITARDSRNGRFVSLTVTITATGTDQLQRIFADLKATGRVHMVL